jgi:hypothetical protein
MGEGVSDQEPVVPYLLAGGCEHPRELPPLPERPNIFRRQKAKSVRSFLGRVLGDYKAVLSIGGRFWLIACSCGHTRKVWSSCIVANRVYRCPNRPVCKGDGS